MIIYGKQVCLYVLKKHKEIIEEIYFGKVVEKNIFNKFISLKKPFFRLDYKKMQSLAKGGNHQGYILKVKDIESCSFKDIFSFSKIIVMVDLSDTGNIGSIFRSSAAFGIDAIISTNNFNKSSVARVSSGAFFDIPYLIFNNTLSLINDLRMSKFKLFGTSINGIDIKDIKHIPNKWALFLGNEGEGMPNRILKRLDDILCIKMKNFDSLNVSVAGGILMHNMLRI